MPNITDYLNRYGDVPLSRFPLSEIDGYLLCKLGCPDYTDVVPPKGEILLPEAVDRYFMAQPEARLGLLSSPMILPAIRQLARLPRFRSLKLCDYVNRVDEDRNEQFSALTVLLPDGTRLVTYRGTDDTLAAWREDFLLGVEDEIPAQRDAARYLLEEASANGGALLVGGHSKGGNLAVYAALSAPGPVQNRIETVYNFDGPGFRQDRSVTPAYLRIRPKLRTILSQHAIVGRLLYHETRCTIVKSSLPGIAAHDGFHWETEDARFLRCREFAPASNAFETAMQELAESMSPERRMSFLSELFSVFSATGAVTLLDLTDKRLRNSVLLAKQMHKSREVHQFIHQLAFLMLRETAADARGTAERKPVKPTKK